MAKLNYRPEIDGLRALAVLSVIVFHAGLHQMSGGFIGVDIFYVISGFLITKIITTSLNSNEFRFSQFYSRRIRRLLPAAITMVTISLIFGGFILTPGEYRTLAKSAASSNLFLANVWLMNNSGYFDASTQITPLAHMWSLAVEEQFYLTFPALLLISHKINKRLGIKILIAVLFISSFGLSILISNKSPNFAFYMLPTRAWELSIGAILTFLPAFKTNNQGQTYLLAFTGVAALIYGLISINHNDSYPGYLALLPCIGAALIIYSSTKSNPVSRVLSLPLLRWIGKISYSAYLWHWPIIVYYRIYKNEQAFNHYEMVILTVISLAAGYLSWRFIEEKFRYAPLSKKSIYGFSTCAILIPILIYTSKGLPQRFSEQETEIADTKLMWHFECTEYIELIPELKESFCIVGAPWASAKHKGIVWGDSHSQHLAQLLDHQAQKKHLSLVIAPKKCPPYLNSEYVQSHYPKSPNFTDECTYRNKLTLELLKSRSDINTIIMSSAWSGHARMLYTKTEPTNLSNAPLESKSSAIGAQLSKHALTQVLSQLTDKNILLLGDLPRPNKVLNGCALGETSKLLRQKCSENMYRFLNTNTVREWHNNSDNILRAMATTFKNVQTIIPSDTLCDSQQCQTYINNELIYKDNNHIRRNLSDDTVKTLSQTIGLENYLNQIH